MVVDDIGLWCQIDRSPPDGRPALFLDRDGVIIVDVHYLGRSDGVQLIEGAASAIGRCNASGIPVVVVTNQSGIGRGYYDWEGFRGVQAAMCTGLAAAGAHLDAVLACAYHGEGKGPWRVDNHPWRKPNPGMILEASSRMGLDITRSWIVGDKVHDIVAGQAASLAGGMLVSSEDEERERAVALAHQRFIVETKRSLAEAVAELIEQRRLAP
jgi:D-glycero-D-manno-heptose 1,7-bisphosphate phosphatase